MQAAEKGLDIESGKIIIDEVLESNTTAQI